ncbi:hypothetical protein ABL78_0830 [Leptomonas seymouri]|uniref:Uncharacterized protein n=1 Tax=Leptomonas seymouri TaxID=5684 RepID=A0A0N0P8Y8_LEPSE|nr:hypothetical protein ABL78_0830 [Leptomonas seymouri]|eukprot:KPI90077.1 hypothetical protein ABL78_0830 [Leptomonas seymouri]
MAKFVLLVGALLSFALCMAAVTATAQRSLECQMAWSEPSADNDLMTCLGNSKRIGSQWRYYVFPGFAALIFLFTMFGLPVVFCCRCCRCCHRCVMPKDTTDRGVARCWLWMWTFIAVIIACGVCVLLVYGSVLLVQSADKILDDADNKTVSYFSEVRDNLTSLLTDYSKNPPEVPNVDMSAFDTVTSEARGNITTIRTDYFKYFHIAEIVVCCVGGVGVALMLSILFFACYRCTGRCVLLWSFFYYFFALIFAILAVVFTLCIYATTAACGEITLQYKREPGLFQWYLVPWCDKKFNFRELRAQVSSLETTAAHSACEQVLTYCDNIDEYPSGNENHFFLCGKGISAASECKTLDDVIAVVTSTHAKSILVNTMCVNQEGMVYLEDCTISECVKRCVDYQHPPLPLKSHAVSISNSVAYATNVSTALSYIHPLIQSNFIIDKAVSTIDTPTYGTGFTMDGEDSKDSKHCSALRSACIMLGVGFFVGALMFILGIYIMHRGSWVWGEMREEEKSASVCE